MRKRSLIFLLAAVLSVVALLWGGAAQAYLSPSNPAVLSWDARQIELMPPSYIGDYVAAPSPYVIGPGKVPDYLTSPNWAFSPLIRKFKDTLPGIKGVTTYNTGTGYTNGENTLNQHIPLAIPDTTTYPNSDYYVIELVEYSEQLHTDLPPTRLRGYRQVNMGGTQPHYLGPLIIAQKDRPVRVLFINNLATGTGGDLFIPVDTTVMGSGAFDVDYDPVTKLPVSPNLQGYFSQNRATLHLHGGRSPWISDGTPHQWITPNGETTVYPEGVSKVNVPDMPDPGPGAQTFYWTNQQSSRLMFYHDHAWGITRLNVYVGEAAGYMIQDPVEIQLITDGIIPADQIPLVIEDKTFVDGDPASPTYVRATDPTWNWGTGAPDVNGIRPPVTGDLWWPHVYMPAQNPYDITGIAPLGRWAYGPYFYPATNNFYQPIPNPYYDIGCDPNYDPTPLTPLDAADIAANEASISGYMSILGAPFCQAPEIPSTPNPSWGAEAFMDTQTVNGTVYPTVTVEPKAYRFRILNASHDRFVSLSLYKADTALNPNIAIADDPLTEIDESLTAVSAPLCATFVGGCATESDVRMLPATAHAGFPATWPIDGRPGGVPDWNMRGPDWVMIGTEGGFLPQPVIIPPQPATWNVNPSMFNVGNINGGSLILGPAERTDVIVDFSQIPSGTTLILYNDGSAPWPALNPQYDFYTGNPDGRSYGAADTTLPGFGPNTRTIMQIKVVGTAAAPFDVTPTGPLFTAFTSQSNHGGPQSVFQRAQDPIIVAQGNMNPTSDPARFETFLFDQDYSAYNKAYDTSFPTAWPNWGLSKINDKAINFVDVTGAGPYKATSVVNLVPNNTLTMKNKAIHDEMGATFDPLGRMRAGLGLELNATTQQVNFVVQTYSDPSTEILKPNEVQVWKISHNGVDTHPIHFHLYDVQILNRVGWDGFIRLPDPTELGWKETVRISPLEDTIVALRPTQPVVPFPLPDSVRPLNPATPLGDTTELSPIDPTTGNNWTTPNVNRIQNFGWEYVWHCHILSHEENDMMRSVIFQVPPETPLNLFAIDGSGGVQLTWTDMAASETGFTVQVDTDPAFPAPVTFAPIGPSVPNTAWNVPVTYLDTTALPATQNYYRVQAFSPNGVSAWSNTAPYVAAPIAGLTPATLAFGNQLLNTTSLAKTVTLSNTGSAPLSITGISTGLPLVFAQLNTCPASLAGGASCTIDVTFAPTVMGGPQNDLLTVVNNDPVNSTLTVSLSGTGVTPIAGVNPLALVFGDQLLNTTSAAQTVTLSNTGNMALTINSITMTGANPGDFGNTTCGASLAAGANCTISVTFKPTAMGLLGASLNINSNDPANPILTVAVSGNGVNRVASVSPVPPGPVAFADQFVNTTSAAQIVTLTNAGNTALTVNSITLGGANPGDFGQTNNCPASLAGAASCQINVTFRPTAAAARSATLSISSNDPVNPTVALNLSGNGIAPAAGVLPTSLAFGLLQINTTSVPQSVTLSNTGNAALAINSIGLTGANAGDFAISANGCGASLPIGGNCLISVTFRPTANSARTAGLTFASNDPVNPSLSVALTGSGTALTLTPAASMVFGNQLIGTNSAFQTITMRNIGTTPIAISGITVTGANAGDFTNGYRTTCGTNLAAGRNCTFRVRFNPLAAGVRTASITIGNSDPANPQTITLSGTGVIGPAAGLLPASLNFGTQPRGIQSAPQAVTLTNTGDAPLVISRIRFSGGNASNFGQTSNCTIGGAGLAVGASCTINVTFTPNNAGLRSSNLQITDNATNSPQSVPVSGTGL